MHDLISIGDSTIDAFHLLDDKEIDALCSLDTDKCQLCFRYSDKIPVADVKFFVAGNAANNAVGATRLGLKTAIYTIIGDNRDSETIRSGLKKEGVDLDYVISNRGERANYSTVLSFRGERTILTYHVTRNYKLPKLDNTKWVYLTSMAKGSETIFDDIAKFLNDTHAKCVYQPGTYQIRMGTKSAQLILDRCEVIIINKEEAEEYLGKTAKSEIKDLLSGLLALGPKIAVITNGSNGSYATQNGRAWFLNIRPEIPRIEATGAGDAYATGFMAALIHGRDVPEAMRWGTFNAEGVIGQYGPQAGLLTYETMDVMLKQTPDFKASEI